MKKAVLFDFDGVIADTEKQYDKFFDQALIKYNLDIPGFALKLKGTQLPEALNTQFPQLPVQLRQQIIHDEHEFGLQMDFPLVPGVTGFISRLKEQGIKIALVTSSVEEKMAIALRKLGMEGLFDTEVMAGRVTRGKPDPMCYQIAAADLGLQPADCVVFEDSLAGIQSGLSAGMRVVGVATTIPEPRLRELKVYDVIHDFTDAEKLNLIVSKS